MRNKDGISCGMNSDCIYDDNLLDSNIDNGIVLRYSIGCEVSGSILSNNDNGLAIGDSQNTTVMFNTVLTSRLSGILAYHSRFQFISNNTIKDNDDGIYHTSASKSIITFNLIENNTNYGVDCHYAYDSQIYLNMFIDNNHQSGPQAFDDGDGDNTWYNQELKKGNHWNDHNSGKPYKVGDAVDRYPLDRSFNRIPRDWSNLIFGISIGIALTAVLSWMAYPRIKTRMKLRRKRIRQRKRLAVQPDYDKIRDEEHQKAIEKVFLER
jgi:parallel beta-helix repeat protein